MHVDEVSDRIELALYELPEELDAQLTDVEFKAVQDIDDLRAFVRLAAPAHLHKVTDDTRGIFVGVQAMPDDPDPQTMEDGDPDVPMLLPAGIVILVATAHATTDEIEETVFHEVAHVLGLDEIECGELGLEFEG